MKLLLEYDELYYLYIVKRLSYKSIGDMYDVDASTVMRKIKKFGIIPRNSYETLRLEIDENSLAKMYLVEGKSCSEIALVLGTNHTTISKRLKEMGIKLKPQREFVSGEKSNFWNGGISSENAIVRSSSEFKIWRDDVFKRDNYTCQCCLNDSGGNLHAHHIENFSEHEAKRFDVLNGITLCRNCHNASTIGSFHYSYGTRNNNATQLLEYIKNRRSELGIDDLELPKVLQQSLIK